MRAFLILLLIAALGVLIWYLLRTAADDYHTTPVAAMLDEELYGGAKAIDQLPVLKPYLYLQPVEVGKPSGYLLNVIIPVPKETAVDPPTVDLSTPGICRISYRAISTDPGGATDGLYHQTLMEVPDGIETIHVTCTLSGSTGSSTVGTTDADDEDPIHGGAPTPYMSSASPDGLMVYTGGGACDAIVTISGVAAPATLSMSATPEFQHLSPGTSSVVSLEVGKRTMSGVR